ncbi:uncharacterized protein LOC143299696 [Babylonia areolata]|uniref:uncharacterized protein LOC143299696 n=1 Tax=Babylonia areolata TaxID=304850 RepID=UPI003FCF04E9
MDFPVLLILLLCHTAWIISGDLNFGQGNGFRLTASKAFFLPHDDVTFTCMKAANGQGEDNPSSLVFPSSKGITWERNGQSLFSTSREGDTCHVQAESVLGRPAVTQRDLEDVTCVEDDASVRVTIRNITVSPRGDRWLCSKFPFLESNPVSLHNFVTLSDVDLSVTDHYPDDVSTGILMTLVCRASPCNPPPTVTWRLTRGDGHVLPLPDRSRTRSQVDGYGRVVVAAELALTADPRYQNATASCSASNALPGGRGEGGGSGDNGEGWITSENVTLSISRPPRVLLTVSPASEVTEGMAVTLTCGAHGHPRPEVRWRREGGYLPGGLREAQTPIIRLNPARAPDQGQYTCRAFNGVPPEVSNSVFLTVNEPVRTLKISDGDRSTEVSEKKATGRTPNNSGRTTTTTTNTRHNHNDDDDSAGKADASSSSSGSSGDDSGSDGGIIAAVVVSVLVVVGAVAVVVVVLLLLNRRRKNFTSPGSMASLFSHCPERSMTAPGAGLYAPRTSQRPTALTPLTLDAFPQYLELPPAPSPPGESSTGDTGFPAERQWSRAGTAVPCPPPPTPTSPEARWCTAMTKFVTSYATSDM